MLRDESSSRRWRTSLSKARDVLYLGRGTNYPLALEGALKLKEISYIHAEGYAAGELKHGPIALIDENVPVIVMAPEDDLFEKSISNLQEVAARGGQIILISNAEPEKPDASSPRTSRCRMRILSPIRCLRGAGTTYRLPYGRHHGHGRGPAAQPGQVRDC